MAQVHTVQQGECFTVIARKYGFADFRTIYDHPQNAELKRKRPDPNLLYPGDQIVIPDRALKTEDLPTGSSHRFVVTATRRLLRINVEDACGHHVGNEPYQLTVGGLELTGTTGGSGELEHPIPTDAEQARLTIKGHTFELDIAHLNPLTADSPDRGVSGAQGRLLNMGYDVGAVDGDLGSQTRQALEQFQRDNGLEVSGELDDATRAKLMELHGC